MAFDPALAKAISDTFRLVCSTRITLAQRRDFEFFLRFWFGLKNIRNAQLWTRYGAVERNFINNRLGQFELDLRVFVAEKFINNATASFPVKEKAFRLPADDSKAKLAFEYFQDSYIRAYCTRIYFEGNFFFIEYAADSDADVPDIDLDSPEFDDILDS